MRIRAYSYCFFFFNEINRPTNTAYFSFESLGLPLAQIPRVQIHYKTGKQKQIIHNVILFRYQWSTGTHTENLDTDQRTGSGNPGRVTNRTGGRCVRPVDAAKAHYLEVRRLTRWTCAAQVRLARAHKSRTRSELRFGL